MTASLAEPPIRVWTLLTVPVLAQVGEGELVGAGAEIDRHGGGEGGSGEGDGVVGGAAGDGLGVGDGGGVGEVAEGQRVAAGGEIDGCVGGDGAESDGVGGGGAEQGCEFLTVPVLATLARVSVSSPAPRSTAMPVVSAVAG